MSSHFLESRKITAILQTFYSHVWHMEQLVSLWPFFSLLMHCRKSGSRTVSSTMSPSGPHQSPGDGIGGGGPFYPVPLLSVCLQLQAKQGPTPAPPRWPTEISALIQAWYRVSQMPLQRHNWHLFSLSSPLQPPPLRIVYLQITTSGWGDLTVGVYALKKGKKIKKEKSANTQLKKKYLYRPKGCFLFFFKEKKSVCKSVVTYCTKKTWKKHIKPSVTMFWKEAEPCFILCILLYEESCPLPVFINDCLFHIHSFQTGSKQFLFLAMIVSPEVLHFFMLTLMR